MSDYDPCKLIDLIGSIPEDGEVTGDEIYSLAEFLNNNRDDCLNWPGNQLVVPLQEIWTDGKVNKTELRRMAKLLIGIRKTWARQADPDYLAVQAAAAKVMNNFDPSQARLPTMSVCLEKLNLSRNRGGFTKSI